MACRWLKPASGATMEKNKRLMDHPFYVQLHQGFMDIISAMNRYEVVDMGGRIGQEALDHSGVGAGPVDASRTMREWRERFKDIEGSGIRHGEFDQLIERWNQATQTGVRPETFDADRRWIMSFGQKPYGDIARELDEE